MSKKEEAELRKNIRFEAWKKQQSRNIESVPSG